MNAVGLGSVWSPIELRSYIDIDINHKNHFLYLHSFLFDSFMKHGFKGKILKLQINKWQSGS